MYVFGCMYVRTVTCARRPLSEHRSLVALPRGPPVLLVVALVAAQSCRTETRPSRRTGAGPRHFAAPGVVVSFSLELGGKGQEKKYRIVVVIEATPPQARSTDTHDG